MCFSLATLSISSNNFISGSSEAILLAFYVVTGLFFKLLPISSTQLVRETLKVLPPPICLNPSPSCCYFWVTLDSWASPAWPVLNIHQRQAKGNPNNLTRDLTALQWSNVWLGCEASISAMRISHLGCVCLLFHFSVMAGHSTHVPSAILTSQHVCSMRT